MESRTKGLRVASGIFALIFLLQLFRLLTHLEIIAGGHRLPFWPSAVALAVSGGLSIWLWSLSRRGDR